MDAIGKTMGATTAMVLPVITNMENKVNIKNGPAPSLDAPSKDESPSSQVALSPKAQSIQTSGLTSVQFDADPESGKSIVTVISKDDNTVIRQIRTPISSGKPIDIEPSARQLINITA